jgi:serine/threonine protein phosphatase 1
MEDIIRIGDYVFVHAGLRPGVPLESQKVGDLRWIRGEFIEDTSPRDFAVVHGHTITPEPQITPLRIGIDTGAFASGELTAIGLEGAERWLVTVRDPSLPD